MFQRRKEFSFKRKTPKTKTKLTATEQYNDMSYRYTNTL